MYLMKDRTVSITHGMILSAYQDRHKLVCITQGCYARGCKIRHMHAGFVEIQNKCDGINVNKATSTIHQCNVLYVGQDCRR